MQKELSIIIINYKTPKQTIRCIKSIQKFYRSELAEGSCEIILVDNASPDNSVNLLKKHIKKDNLKVNLIVNEANSGFGGGCNYGASLSKGKYLLFLNSDTKIISYGLNEMLGIFKSLPLAGIVGGKLLNPNRTTQLTVGRFHDMINVLFNLIGLEYKLLLRSPEQTEEVDWVSGGCFIVEKKLFNSIKGFDEKIFMYMEDVDLCYRVSKAGRKIIFFPDIEIIHEKGASSDHMFMIVNTYKGYLYFFKKHRSKLEFYLMKNMFHLKAIIYTYIGKVTGSDFMHKTYNEVARLTK